MRRKRTPRWFAPVAIAFVISAAVFIPRWFRNWGDWIPMKIREMHVQGAQALSTVDLKAMAGVHEGGPLFGKWSKEALARVSQNPRIERVAMVRDVTGKIVMRVSEREAVAMVNLDRLYFVDREGNVMEPADPRLPAAARLVVFTGPWRKISGEGMKEPLWTGLALRAALLDAGFEEKEISELHFDSQLGWVLYRVGAASRAIFGSDQFTEKATRLARVLQDFRNKEGTVKEIDLDFRDRAIVKMKHAG